MAGTTVKIKQSSVASKIPVAGDISQGELALNTADQKLYSKDGSGTIFEIGGGSAVAGANEIVTTDFTATNNQTDFSVSYSYLNDHVNVYYNGVHLSTTDFTATNGTTVVLDTGATTGDLITIEVIKALALANGSEIDEQEFTATASQTTFTISGGYNATSSDIEVYVNGVKIPTADFTATNGTSVVLGTACAVNDQVAVRVIKVVALASVVNTTSDTGAAIIPVGTTAQRDGSPLAGYLRWNSTLNRAEIYNDNTSAWQDVGQQTLTTEEVQDIIGGMVSSNTETDLTITYDDTNGKIDFALDLSDAEIKTAYENNSDTNAYTDAEQTKVGNLSGTNTGDQTITLTGDVTGSGTGSFAATIAADAVTYAKIQNVSATDRILGRDTTGAGVIEEITPANLRTMINVEDGATADQTATEIKTAYESNSDTNEYSDAEQTKVSNLSGTNTGDQTITLTGDVTGSGTGSFAGTIKDDVALGGDPTTTTQSANDNSTKIATTAYVQTELTDLIDGAPGTLDTLNELAAAINDDASYASTLTTALSTKLPLAGGQMTGNITMSSTETVDGRDLSVDGAKLDLIEASAKDDQTAAEIRTLVGSATDSNVYDDAAVTKLSNIEASADVTDATNVNAAGALMLSDTTTSGLGIVVDEDNMASDSATKVPTQQSVKAYVDTQIGGENTLAEDDDVNITSPGDASLLLYDTGTSTWRDAALSGDATIGDTGVITVSADAITYAKMQNVVADERILGRVSGANGVVEELTKAQTLTMLNVEDGATGDQTAAEIKTAYESNSDTNEYSDAEQTKVSNLSGTNTGDQTITLTGDVTGSGTGSFAGTIKDDVALGGNPTTTTQSASNNTTRIATTAYVDAQVATVVDSAPAALNTLNELADALGDDANYATTTATSIGTKLPKAGGEMTGNITMSGTETVDGRDLSVDGAKLDLIDASADVTDATTVAAAGAVMESDTTIASMSFVVDEDDMTSDSATKLSTQQAIKAYVDAQIQTVPDAVAMAIALG